MSSDIMVIKMTNCWHNLCLQNLFRGIINKKKIVSIHWTVQGVNKLKFLDETELFFKISSS